jgi:hypothetical protein
MRATCPVHSVPLDIITLIIFGVKYQLWSFSLLNFPQLFVTSSRCELCLPSNIVIICLISGLRYLQVIPMLQRDSASASETP